MNKAELFRAKAIEKLQHRRKTGEGDTRSVKPPASRHQLIMQALAQVYDIKIKRYHEDIGV